MSAEWAAHSLQPIQPTSINQKTLFAAVNLSLMHVIPNIQVPVNPFCAKSLKTNYNVVPYVTHGTERVNHKCIFFSETDCHMTGRSHCGSPLDDTVA